MDMDFDSDEDTEVQLNDLRHLTAVLEADEASTNEIISRGPASIASTSKSTTTTSNELFKIESALALNRLYDEKLGRLEKILSGRLRDCRSKLKVIQGTGTNTEKHEVFRYLNCGKPYFRDKSNFPAPDNDDTLMAKSQMYDFSQIISVPGWTVRDKSQFITVIHKMSQDIRKTELRSKIAELKRQEKLKKVKDIKKQIAVLEDEIDSLSMKPLTQLALPLSKEYDWDTLANKLNRRHTAQEYQALWKLFFHPSIQKDSWSKTEHASLQSIANEFNLQDWDAIAKKLNTGRTGYQCFVYFRTNMANITTGQKWSNEEVAYLKRLIDYFKQDNYIPWGKIAAAMENRSKIQIYNKYLRLIEQRKGRFLPEEDAVILNCVERFGEDFRRMTNYLPGRSMSQVRIRYQVLSHMRISTVWTVEDDRKLVQIMSNQDSDMNFSSATKYFPGKNRMNIRSRYLTLKRWMKRHPYMDIQNAPRRGARRLNHGKATEDLNKAIENLKNTLKTEAEIKTSTGKKKITMNSTDFDIEDAIIATLINERLKEEECKKYTDEVEKSFLMTHDNTSATNTKPLTNLNKCLIFLESRLNKERYEASNYSVQYPELGKPEQEICRVSVKSYSRKPNTDAKMRTIKIDGSPDVWGNCMLTMRKLALPPHYATITGCRALMGYVNSTGHDSINIHAMLKRNCILKEQYNILLDRFQILFLWPMLLSNELPVKHVPSPKVVKVKRPNLPSSPAFGTKVKTINKKYKMNASIAPNGIDIIDCDQNKDITIEENMCGMVDTELNNIFK